jgi:imidazolonepropionase-like amidohydrolase
LNFYRGVLHTRELKILKATVLSILSSLFGYNSTILNMENIEMRLLIKQGIILTMNETVPIGCNKDSLQQTGTILDPGDILIEDGKIIHIAPNIENSEPSITEVIYANGCFVMPGIIESHCHIGITEERSTKEGDDCNESTDPVTPYLRALDAINPMDSAFYEAIKAGITSVMVGPGSTNIIGGQFLFMKTWGSRRIDDLVVKHPAAMKAAFGENPKVFYGEKDIMPSTRMGIASMLREVLFEAKQYFEKKCSAQENGEPFLEDFRKEPWIPVLKREIPLKSHVHRCDDILTAIRVATEYHIDLTLDHCSEGHLIVDFIKETGFPAIIGPDMASRNKLEVENMAFKTAGILNRAGITVAITTDHPVSLIQTLPLCAGLAAKNGLGIPSALLAITKNPAKICRVDHLVGSLEIGKDADIAIFDGNPMELFTQCLYTIINGQIVYRYEDDMRPN